ncbi:MAG: hypothetical protein AseanaTS_30350 [Candidatus Pelagadaptatus aseana]|uniref:hypothetical protein n=1 Tax=Candidatus Pelagadaptatus aseana TaxID=3120508 RepID=UPI0039B1B73E
MKPFIVRRLCWALAILTLLFHALAVAEQRPTIRFGCLSSEDMPDYQYALSVYTQSFDRLGYDFEMSSAATSEIIRRLNDGTLDGDCARNESFTDYPGVPTLLKTRTAGRQVYMAAWSLRENWRPDLLRLENRKTLRFGFIREMVYLQRLSQQMGYERVTLFDSVEQGIAQLRAGTIDVWLDYEAVFGGERRTLLDNDIRMVGALVTYPVYPFLLEKHRDLIEPLSRELARQTAFRPYEHDFNLSQAQDKRREKGLLFACPLSEKVPMFRLVEQLYRDAFAALGYEFKMVSLPLVRSEAELQAGRIDGSCARGAAFMARHPEVVRLPGVEMPTSYQVWALSPDIGFRNLADLQRHGGRVGLVWGDYQLETVLTEAGIERLYTANSTTVGLKMLASGQLDMFVGTTASVQSVIQSLKITRPLYMVGDVHQATVFPVLRSGLEALAEPLAMQLQRHANGL